MTLKRSHEHFIDFYRIKNSLSQFLVDLLSKLNLICADKDMRMVDVSHENVNFFHIVQE